MALDQDALDIAYSILVGLHRNIPDTVSGPHVDEFHGQLRALEATLGLDLKAYRIPDDFIEPAGGLVARLSGSQVKCSQSLYRARLDAILTRFQILEFIAKEGRSPIGFKR